MTLGETVSIDRIAFSISEVVAATGLGRTTIYKLLGTGKLASVKVGKRRLVKAADLDIFLSAASN